MHIEDIRNEIVEAGKRLYLKNFVASNDGNISVRLSHNQVMITPSGVSKGYMKPEDMLIVDMDGKVLSGDKKPSSEMKMHLEVYKVREDVNAIVHAHPQKATAFAVARLSFDRITLPEVVFSLGLISVAEYGTPTTDILPRKVVEKIGNVDALLLQNHGALTVGKDAMDAYYKMETLEHFCAISLYARMLGGEKALDEVEAQKLYQIRKDVYGKDMPGCKDCGFCNKICNQIKTPSIPAINSNSLDKDKLNEQEIKQKVREIVRQILLQDASGLR